MDKEKLRRVAIAVGVGLLLLAGAFSAGRFSAPMKVETRDVEKVIFKDKIVEKIVTVEVKGKTERQIVWRDRIIAKDGTVTEHEVEKTVTKEDTKTTGDTAATSTHDGSSEHTTEKVVTLQSRWRVGLLVGGSVKAPLLPIAGPLVLGVEGHIRIIGGVSAGLWANTVGAAGAAIALEF